MHTVNRCVSLLYFYTILSQVVRVNNGDIVSIIWEDTKAMRDGYSCHNAFRS